MSIWTKLFGTQSHSPKVHRQLGLERLDDRVLPSVTLLDVSVNFDPTTGQFGTIKPVSGN
jgi:hypothetical protein